MTAAQIITNLQTIVSRQVNLGDGAAVISVGQITGGNRNNIIPESATFIGTIRTLNDTARNQTAAALKLMAEKTAEASGLTAEVKIDKGYPVLFNDADLTGKMLDALERATGPGKIREVPPVLGAEDFGAFSSKVPGLFWFLNAPVGDKAGAPNHSPLFMIGEQHMKVGVKALVSVTTSYMQTKK